MRAKIGTLLFLSFLFVTFQNCVGGSASHNDDVGGFGKSCEVILRRLFADTYYPFLANNCSNCHRDQSGIENGTGKWAQSDVNRAYDEFAGATRNRVRNRILDNGHKSPLTGSHNQPFIDAHEARWRAAEAEVENCKSGPQFSTAAKTLTGTADAQGFYTVEWDLFTEVRRESLRQKIHVIVRMKIKPGVLGTSPVYQFKEVTGRLRTGSPGSFSVGGVQIERNGELVTDFTTWLFFNSPNVTTATATPLHTAGDGFATVIQTALTDQFALRVTWVKDANGVEM